MVYGYFRKGTSEEFERFRLQLVTEELTSSIKPDEQGEILKRFQCDFIRYCLPVLDDIDNGSQGAERKLQAAMVIPMVAICSIASAQCHNSTFKFHMEPIVSSAPLEQVSDLDIVELTVSSPSAQKQEQKTVALVELKHGSFPIVTSQPFSQLVHAAALAYNSNKWHNCLLCCMGSLSDWHLFVLKECTDESGKHFAITTYHRHCLRITNASLTDFYRDLVKKMSHVIVCLSKSICNV